MIFEPSRGRRAEGEEPGEVRARWMFEPSRGRRAAGEEPGEVRARMKRGMLRAGCCGLVLVLLTACGGRTKEDIIQKARSVSTRTELEQVLGQPTDIAKLGP